MSRIRTRRAHVLKLLLAFCCMALLLAAVPVFAGWITINTSNGMVDAAWPATPLYSSNCDNASIADYLEIKNAWIVNNGTDITFRIETCATTANYSNIRMAAGIDCNQDGDVVDPYVNGPDGDRKAVQIIAQGTTGDQVLLLDGSNRQIVQMPAGYSERIGANFEWKVGLQYLYPACRASIDYVNIGVGTVLLQSGRPVTMDETPLSQWNIPIDYGDAINPDPQASTCTQYPTRLNCDGARHGLGSALRLGTQVDPDGGQLFNSDATADDLSNLADEDGVAPTLGFNWTPSGSGKIDVTVTGGSGVLNCWVDWNRDSDWADSGEKIINEAAVTAGTNTRTFNVPSAATFPNSYTARCRLSPATGQAATVTGAAEFGEVEDYVWAFGSTGNRPAPLTLSISLAPSPHDVRLDWAATPSNESYLILRSSQPYFQPGDAGVSTFTDPNNASPYQDTGVAGNTGAPTSLYYAGRGQVTSSTPAMLSALSNRVGLFEFGLTPGAN